MQSVRQDFDFNELAQEARSRWLRPVEVLFILQNHKHYKLTSEPPHKPPSGSLFLFNRRILRYFRKDGHVWRKKRDGRTIGEAHEHLKVGSVDALNCYYAHGQQNPNFQRRSYWMLDRDHEDIVLVHYREVAERRPYAGSVSNLSFGSPAFGIESTSILTAQNPGRAPGISEVFESYVSSFSPGSAEEVRSKSITRSDEIYHLNDINISVDFGGPSKPGVSQALLRLTDPSSLDDDYGSLYYNSQDKKPQSSRVLGYDGRALEQDTLIDALHSLEYQEQELNENSRMQDALNINRFLQNADDPPRQHSQALGLGSPSWKEILELCSSSSGVDSREKNSRTPTMNAIPGDGGNNEANGTNYQTSESNLSLHLSMAKQGNNNPTVLPTPTALYQEDQKPKLPPYSSATDAEKINSDVGRLSKMNTIGWMETKQMAIGNSKYSAECSNMWFDQESDLAAPFGAELGLTVAQIQRFSIREISPEWSYSTESSKVIITGDFLCDPEDFVWHCMFGDIEVPVEIIQKGVLRCRAPTHASGKVSICITCGNRESCSEVRDFEYLVKPNRDLVGNNLPHKDSIGSTEELLLLVRLAEMLLRGNTSPFAHKEYNVESKTGTSGHLKMADDPWERIIHAVLAGVETPTSTMEWLLQELLKVQLEHWLSSKSWEGEMSGGSLTKPGQCIIHMIAGLGYEWALSPILNSGVGINFRDMHGWTALHWAARFGREKMVAALLAANASAGAVTDPTSQDPAGKTVASIAYDCGHKGLAAYLSEVSLTSHLSSLTLGESEISKNSAAVEAEKTAASISEKCSIQLFGSATEDQLSLEDSLAAVRNATQAAARIQAAFRSYSLKRKQQLAASGPDEYGMIPVDIHGISAALCNHDHKLDRAALSIQKKYRGWKGRRQFLFLRQNVVKIQAHVRGHQDRKKYKEILWTVGVLEKAILRWRRRGFGLRGFQVELKSIDEIEDDILKVFRKQKVDLVIDQAVSRVLSMVESPEARHQYRRMLERYQQAKAELLCNSDEVASSSHGINENMENNDNDINQFI